MEDFAAAQRRLVAETDWVIEGNYASTLPIRLAAADTVILLDLPARTCLRGIVGRHLAWSRAGASERHLQPDHLAVRSLGLGLPAPHAAAGSGRHQ